MIPKFRAWDSYDEKMVAVLSIDFENKVAYVEQENGDRYDIHFDNLKFMQSTGLKDKNGVEIFEGDIIKTKTGILQSVEYIRASVTKDWSETVAAFKCRQGDEYFYFDLATDEVIGNIYEDKELLEVE